MCLFLFPVGSASLLTGHQKPVSNQKADKHTEKTRCEEAALKTFKGGALRRIPYCGQSTRVLGAVFGLCILEKVNYITTALLTMSDIQGCIFT